MVDTAKLSAEVDKALDDVAIDADAEVAKAEHDPDPEKGENRLIEIANKFSDAIDNIGERLDECLTKFSEKLEAALARVGAREEPKESPKPIQETPSQKLSETRAEAKTEPLLKGAAGHPGPRMEWL